MSFYIQSLFIAIPIFFILIILEWIASKKIGKTVNISTDVISSLSSGMSNITKDSLNLVETDCPYLSPVPFRGKPNEPGRARFVAEKISEIFQLPFEIIAAETTKNASKLFNL